MLKDKFQQSDKIDYCDPRIPKGWRYIRVGEKIPKGYLYWDDFGYPRWAVGCSGGYNHQSWQCNSRRITNSPFILNRRNGRINDFTCDFDEESDYEPDFDR